MYVLCKKSQTQVVQVHLQLFRCNSLLKCVTAQNRKKIHYNPLFEGFKVIDVDMNKTLVTIACDDKQHVCAYLQPFSCYTR